MRQILVIEDDPTLRKAAERVLVKKGFQVTTAADGMAGLREVEDKTFDAIVCDFDMPGLNGRQVWEKLSPEHQARFLLWSGNVEEPSPSGIKVPKGGPASELLAPLARLLTPLVG